MDKKVHVSKYGSLRYNTGKPELTQLHPQFLLDFAAMMTECSKKYKVGNYAKGQEYRTPADSLQRHMLAFLKGEDIDPESGFHHALHMAANAMIIYCSCLLQDPELDNRIEEFNERAMPARQKEE